MASVTLRAGISSGLSLAQGALLVVGKNKHLKNVNYKQVQNALNGFVGMAIFFVFSNKHSDEKLWQTAIEQLPESGNIPLYLNQAKIVSIPDKVSRHNAPSGAVNIFREVRDASFGKGSKVRSFSLVLPYYYFSYLNILISRP